MIKDRIINKMKRNQILTDITLVENGTDRNGFDLYKTVYNKTPLNYQLVYLDTKNNQAVLKDLDYVEPKI